MCLTLEIANRRDFQNSTLYEMHKLRAEIFGSRLGWEVSILSGMEIDGYDAMDPYYMIVRGSDGQLRGCWRLLTTEGPYMLKDSFPQLLHGVTAPADPKIWELSRFAIKTDKNGAFGFSDIAMQSITKIITYGYENTIAQYVTVTTTAIERMLRKAGIVVRRFGPPIVIGVETTVALYIEIAASYAALTSFNVDYFMPATIDLQPHDNSLAIQQEAVTAEK